MAYGVWGLVLQAPESGRLTIVGGLPTPLLKGRIPPCPRRWNSCPSLPMIPISPLLCTRPRSDGSGSAVDSTLSHIPSPVVPYGVILLVYRDSIVFVVVVALKISTLCTSYHQLSPLNHKVLFVSCFACYIWTNWQSQFAMKCTLEWQLSFKRVHFFLAFWQQPHAIKPKTADPVQSCNLKSQRLSFVRPFLTQIFKPLKKNVSLMLGWTP